MFMFCLSILVTMIIYTSSGKSVNHAEDRVCSTAVAVNALLYTWTANHRLDPSTPVAVNNTVVKACKWLLKNSLSGKYKNFNVLFSGSVKLAAVSD